MITEVLTELITLTLRTVVNKRRSGEALLQQSKSIANEQSNKFRLKWNTNIVQNAPFCNLKMYLVGVRNDAVLTTQFHFPLLPANK